jgi:uncharacterized membrane protein
MRWLGALVSVALALFLLLAGFFSVYADRSAQSIYAQRMHELAPPQQEQMRGVYAFLEHQTTGFELFCLDEGLHGCDVRSGISFLTVDEAQHMRDVRGLLDLVKVISLVLILMMIICAAIVIRKFRQGEKTTKKNELNMIKTARILRTTLLAGGVLALLVVGFLALSAYFGFSDFWTAFHHVLFPQGNWQFSTDSVLITLFPQGFFEGFSSNVMLAAASYGILAILTSMMIAKRQN